MPSVLSAGSEMRFIMSNILKHIKKVFLLLILVPFITGAMPQTSVAASSGAPPYIILPFYGSVMDIGEETWLCAYTSTGKKPTFKSSNSKVASVNTYGYITAKGSGTATITVKIKDAEASCYITVRKTKLTLNRYSLILEHGETFKLNASTSNNSTVKWKSGRKSIASVDDRGFVTANKPGDTVITVKADDTVTTCKVKVKSPTLTLDIKSLSMYRLSTVPLKVNVSSGISPKWKSNRSSVAVVDQNGYVTAIKNGTATISATVDGVTVTCSVTVKKPDIILSDTDITLKAGQTRTIKASVSSGNTPLWSTSNSDVATVSSSGKIKAIKKGTATITVIEDGTKAKCKVHVTT